MAKKRKEDTPPPGSPGWMATFGDLMNLLLCFFVLLFSMSSVDAQKFELIAASFNQTFSIFSAGGAAIGEGAMISNGVSQLTQLDNFINNVGLNEEVDSPTNDFESAAEYMEEAKLKESEALAEKIEEALAEKNMLNEVDIEFTSQYVELTLNGALLFRSGSVEIQDSAVPILEHVGLILQRYNSGVIEIEGHTDTVPMSGAKYSDNDELSAGRALSVFRFIVSNTSIDPAIIKHSGRGEYAPITDNTTPEGREKNRRVEIRIYNSLSSY